MELTQDSLSQDDLTPEQIQEFQQEHLTNRLQALGFARAASYRRSVQQAEQIRKRYNLNPNAPDYYYSVGDMVKMKHFSKTKLEFDWKGPYHIVDIGHPGTYWLMKPTGERLPSTVNPRDLSPWLARLNSNEEYFYDGTNAANAELQTQRSNRITSNQNEANQPRKRVGIPIRVPTNPPR